MGRLFTALWLLIFALSIGACNRGGGSAAAAGLHVTLVPAAEGDHITVEIVDSDGRPVTDAAVSLEGNMTHAGMVPVLTEGVWDGADGAEDGSYRLPFAFTMLGDWIITVKIERRDGDPLSEDIEVTVTGETVTVK